MQPINQKSAISGLLGGLKKIFAKKFLYDVLKTFIGVFLAFWVSEWKASKQSQYSEKTVLSEIRKDLVLDLADMEGNLQGHKDGKQAVRYFWRALNGTGQVHNDSFFMKYNLLLRSFTSIQHSAAYESVKSRGLEIIQDDSLRANLVNIFDFDMESIGKLEEGYPPHSFFVLYSDKFNEKLAPYVQIDSKSQWTVVRPLSEMPEKDKQLLRMWLYRISADRSFLIYQYQAVIDKMKVLQEEIDRYLGEG